MPVPIDLGFIFGSNGINATDNFNAEKRIAKKLLDEHKISRKSSLVGAIVYDSDARIVMRIGEFLDKKSTIDGIDKLKRYRDGNDIEKALALARDRFFSVENLAKRDSAKNLVLFLDTANGLTKRANEIAKDLKAARVKIFVVVVGKEADVLDVLTIPTDSKGLVQVPDPKRELDSALKRIGSTAKPGA